MSTSIPTVLTKTRKSQLILEGTAAVVAGVLLLWIFLWYLGQKPDLASVLTYYIEPSGIFVPYQEADARGLYPAQPEGQREPLTRAKLLGDLSTKLKERSKTPSSVLWVSSPSYPVSGDAPLSAMELIQKVVDEAEMNVLIILDMAQVDSSRELGVFGNAPYKDITKEKLAELKPPKSKANIFVLLSCEPGQKSWMMDGQGRSVFSYFVQEYLAPGKETGSPKSIEELFDFVHTNTSEWVRLNRGQAIQKPKLIAVGSDSKPFKLPPLKVQKPGAPVPSKIESIASKEASTQPAAKSETAKPAEPDAKPQPDPKVKLLDDLLVEWKKYDELLHRADRPPYPPPFRDAPAHWRIYEFRLLQAERVIRAAWNDSTLVDKARKEIESAIEGRKELETSLKSAKKEEDDFPFQPVFHNTSAEGTLNETLRFVTGKINQTLARPPDAPLVEAAPGKPVVEKAQAGPPLVLENADYGKPTPYLELQLPVWAFRFHKTFKVQSFIQDPERGARLREAVFHRLPAELALAVDRRGLRWIETEIEKADEIRRSVQDELFDISDAGSSNESLKARIIDYGGKYETALKKIEKFHEARTLLDKIAAQLPYYGQWKVLRTSAEKNRDPASPATSRSAEAYLKFKSLREALDKPDDSGAIQTALTEANIVFEALVAEFDNAVGLINRDSEREWRAIDDALSVPLISPSDRERLLKKVVGLGNSQPIPIPVGTKREATRTLDPGFKQIALELARLEQDLRQISSDQDRDEVEKFAKAIDGIERIDSSKDDEKAMAELVTGFDGLSRPFRELSTPLNSRWNNRKQEKDFAKKIDQLRAFDREIRFRTSAEMTSYQDQATRDYETISRLDTIRFHAQRLEEDFDRSRVAELKNQPASADLPKIPFINTNSGELTPDIGDDTIEIDEKLHQVNLQVNVKIGDPGIPKGRAFVGVYNPASGASPEPVAGPEKEKDKVLLEISLPESSSSSSSNLAGKLFSINNGAKPAPLDFKIKQQTSADPNQDVKKSLIVKVFYRGRVDGDGQDKKVIVTCRDFGEPFAVEISQDREELGRIYTPAIAMALDDVFKVNRGKGFFHRGGRLDYILSITNKTSEPQTIILKKSLEQRDGKNPKDDDPTEHTLGPLETKKVRWDRVTADDAPIGVIRILKVQLSDKRNKLKPVVKEYEFKQLDLNEYLRIEGFHDFDVLPNRTDKGHLFKVKIERLSSDPVREPIFRRKIKVTIGGKVADDTDDRDDLLGRDPPIPGTLIKGGNTREFIYGPVKPGDDIPWEVEVEGIKWNKKKGD